ncbi:uncharacterized protein DS421_12g362020 [Arachis hypogaea]|nr:uncharacterized protein DS421_12g362020 [Arachis hypogaea]
MSSMVFLLWDGILAGYWPRRDIAGVWNQRSTRRGRGASVGGYVAALSQHAGGILPATWRPSSTTPGSADSPRRGRRAWRPVKRSRDSRGVPMLLLHHVGACCKLPACRGQPPPPSNRNLLVRKLDPPHTWNPMVENYLRATGFYHVSRIGVIRGFHPMLVALVERWRPETHTFVLPIGEVTVTLENVAHIFGLPIDGEPVNGWTDSSSDFVQSQGIAIFGREPSVSHNAKSYIKLGWVRRIRDAEPLDTKESIRRYVRCQIFCLLGSTLFTGKSTTYAHAKYLLLLCDFEQIHTYSWGSACLAHIYRALCRASRYDTKEMDGPLNLLFVWAWERMLCLAPVPRQTLLPAEISVARRWSHSKRTTAWLSKTIETFRHDIDYMQEGSNIPIILWQFKWRPYHGLIVPDELHPYLEVCDIVAPLLSFECVEWHPVDRVMRQFGYAQPPPRAARDIPLDQHCIVLRGVQLHDWTVLHGPWIAEWANRRHSRLRDQHPFRLGFFTDGGVLGLVRMLLRTSPPAPQPPAPQHTVFEPIPYYIPQPPAYSHGSHHTQGSHHSQHSQHSHHAQSSHHSQHSDQGQSGQHHDPILTIPSGHDWFDFSSSGHGDQQLQHWTNADLGGWSDFSGIPSLSVSADPHRASVDMAHGLRGCTSDHTSGSASCDSGFIQRQRAYTVVNTFNPGPSASAEAGRSAAPTDAGGSAAPTEAGGSGAPGVDDLVRGHPYDLRMERNPPDRYTPLRFGRGIMGKGLNYLAGKK